MYGDINLIPTTGASIETGRQDGQNYSGIFASEKLAEADLPSMNCYKTKIKSVARNTGIDPSIIAAIISRESRAGTALTKEWGDHYNAFGLMQIDRRYHPDKIQGAWNSEEHIFMGTKILCDIFDDVVKKFPWWNRNQQMKGAIAAYNKGLYNIQSFDTVDWHTTGGDYSNDVVARAQFYKRHGY